MVISHLDTNRLHHLALLLGILIYIVPVGATSHVSRNTPDSQDICMGESFSARCGEDEVIIIHSAKFGRMSEGRCLPSAEFGFLGCSNDVLSLTEQWCSGRGECQFVVPNRDFDDANENCSKDLRLYLKISYSCVKVAHPLQKECSNRDTMTLSQSEGFIASHVTDTTGCGTRSAPWRIEAQPGQIIEVSLVDFGDKTTSDDPSKPQPCLETFGYVLERDLGINRTICKTSTKQRTVYTSKTNRLEIHLTTDAKRSLDSAFIFRYEFTGCPDLTPPAHAWYRRRGSEALIGCQNTDIEWRLTCYGTTWFGENKNCTALGHVTNGDGDWTSDSRVAVLAGVIGVVIVIVVMIIAGGMGYLRRRRRQRGQMPHPSESEGKSGYATNPYYQPFNYEPCPVKVSSTSTPTSTPTPTATPSATIVREDNHSPQNPDKRPVHIWETPLPDPLKQTIRKCTCASKNKSRENSRDNSIERKQTKQKELGFDEEQLQNIENYYYSPTSGHKYYIYDKHRGPVIQ